MRHSRIKEGLYPSPARTAAVGRAKVTVVMGVAAAPATLTTEKHAHAAGLCCHLHP